MRLGQNLLVLIKKRRVYLFHSICTNQPAAAQKHKYTLLIDRYPGRQESNLVTNKKDSKSKLYMHNTIGDVH